MISERDYRKMRSDIEERYRRDLDALDHVWQMAHHGQPPPQSKSVSRKANPKSSVNAITAVLEGVSNVLEAHVAFNKRAEVRGVIQTFSGAFGSKDVRAALDAANPQASASITDNQLSSIISRLCDLNEIHAVIPKSGRTPATYARGPKQLETRAS